MLISIVEVTGILAGPCMEIRVVDCLRFPVMLSEYVISDAINNVDETRINSSALVSFLRNIQNYASSLLLSSLLTQLII